MLSTPRKRKSQSVEAKNLYKTAWTSWCLVRDIKAKKRLQEYLQDLQEQIAPDPQQPEWHEFIATIPGYVDFWRRVTKVKPQDNV